MFEGKKIKDFFNSVRDGIMIELIQGVNSDIEKFHFYINSGVAVEEAARRVGGRIENGFLIIERKPTWRTARNPDVALVIYKEKISEAESFINKKLLV